jgi:hypothetical protein
LNAAYDAFVGGGYQNSISASGTVIGGGSQNSIGGSGPQAAIVGGYQNTVNAYNGFIGDGQQNAVTYAHYSSITGGSNNTIVAGLTSTEASAQNAAIDGGAGNTIAALVNGGAQYAFIGAGSNNVATGVATAVAGGEKNQAGGLMAAVPGGFGNEANGATSFAAGYGADAATNGSFVWADYSPGAGRVVAKRANVFLARASGGVIFYTNVAQTAGVSIAPGSGTWSSLSDRMMKTDIVPLDDAAVLEKVAALPVSEWSYTSERGVRHIGPMAQDFYAAFKVGEDDRHITTIDEDGVALAAVKALRDENESLRRDVRALQREVAALARR